MRVESIILNNRQPSRVERLVVNILQDSVERPELAGEWSERMRSRRNLVIAALIKRFSVMSSVYSSYLTMIGIGMPNRLRI